MTTKMDFNPASAVFFMYIGGLATLIVLGGAGALSKTFTADVIQLLAVAAIILAAAAWVIDRITSL